MILETDTPDFIPPFKDQSTHSISTEQVSKLKQEKKEIEDDIKRLKLVAFKLKSEMAFASTTSSNTETTDSIVVNHIFPKRKSAFPSLSSQINIGKKNIPRMAMKELSHSDQDDYPSIVSGCDFDWSEYDKRQNSSRYYTKEGPEPITTESMKQKELVIHEFETTAAAIRRSSETASSTVELFNRNLSSFKNKLKQGYSGYVWESEHVIKIPVIIKLDVKTESIFFEQSELLFGFFPKHDIPPVKIADICEIMPGADINIEESSPRSSSTVAPTSSATPLVREHKTTDIEVNANNDSGNISSACNPTSDTVYGSCNQIDNLSVNPLTKGSQKHTSIVPTTDYSHNVPLTNSNITSSDKSQYSSHNNDKSCLLSIVSKSDGDIDVRRLAFQLPVTEDRNALLTGIRTLASELHMVHMNELPDRLLRLRGAGGKQDSQSRLANFKNSRQINIPHSLGQQIKNKNLIINVDSSSSTAEGVEAVREEEVRSSIISSSSGSSSEFSSTTDEGPLTPTDFRSSMCSDSESFFKFDGKDSHNNFSDKHFTGSAVADGLVHKQQTGYNGVVAGVSSPKVASSSQLGQKSFSAYSSDFSLYGAPSFNSGTGTRRSSVLSDCREVAWTTTEGQLGVNIERVNREKMFIQVVHVRLHNVSTQSVHF